MLKFYNYDIVFQEIPDEVTLAVNITHCPIHCPQCHSKFLWEDVGEPLNEESASIMIEEYKDAITCISFMGGDNEPAEVNRMAAGMKQTYPDLKVAWYSGRQELSPEVDARHFDYIKLGPYVEKRGGLKSPSTNQRLYKILETGEWEDITHRFRER